jgi:hypothetical protein
VKGSCWPGCWRRWRGSPDRWERQSCSPWSSQPLSNFAGTAARRPGRLSAHSSRHLDCWAISATSHIGKAACSATST